MIVKKFGIDFNSPDGALTLEPSYVFDGLKDKNENYPCALCSRTHSNGWTVCGEIVEDYFYWVNYFQANHPEYGKVWGDFETEVFASSEEAFQDFYKSFPPTAWDYLEI